MGNPKKLAGDAGEAFAAAHLESHGFQIIARNFRTRLGEIDIIACGPKGHRGQGDVCYLLFVEVKARKAGSMVSGEEAVDYHKQHRLRAAAEYYLAGHPNKLQPRFDVMCVELGPGGCYVLTNWIVDAF